MPLTSYASIILSLLRNCCNYFRSPPAPVILSTKLTTTAANSAKVSTVGPNRSSNPPFPRIRMFFARQWKVTNAYNIAASATIVNRPADIWPTVSPKLSKPIARPPRMTVKLSHERNVRSFAKKTLGSTRVGRAMRLPGSRVSDKVDEERRQDMCSTRRRL